MREVNEGWIGVMRGRQNPGSCGRLTQKGQKTPVAKEKYLIEEPCICILIRVLRAQKVLSDFAMKFHLHRLCISEPSLAPVSILSFPFSTPNLTSILPPLIPPNSHSWQPILQSLLRP